MPYINAQLLVTGTCLVVFSREVLWGKKLDFASKMDSFLERNELGTLLRIRIRMICMFLVLLDPDPLGIGTDPDPYPSIINQNSKKNLDFYCLTVL
jgi:hypothetical protein